jgi:hypothetical protein
MKARISLALGVAAVLALPAIAQASLPSSKSTLIVPAKSLAGLKLNSSLAAASAAWGKGGSCSPSGCEYGLPSNPSGTASFVLATKTEGAPLLVVEITIGVGRTGTKPNFNTPLARYKTSSGIGLGSTVAALKHAYPHLISSSTGVYGLVGAGESGTTFVAEKGRVESISTRSVELG